MDRWMNAWVPEGKKIQSETEGGEIKIKFLYLFKFPLVLWILPSNLLQF